METINTTDTPRTDAARIGELERELQSMSNRLENMTESRDCMIEDRNLLEVEVARLRELLTEASYRIQEPAFVKEIEDALATAPEEPVSECKCDYTSIIRATHNGKTYGQ